MHRHHSYLEESCAWHRGCRTYSKNCIPTHRNAANHSGRWGQGRQIPFAAQYQSSVVRPTSIAHSGRRQGRDEHVDSSGRGGCCDKGRCLGNPSRHLRDSATPVGDGCSGRGWRRRCSATLPCSSHGCRPWRESRGRADGDGQHCRDRAHIGRRLLRGRSSPGRRETSATWRGNRRCWGSGRRFVRTHALHCAAHTPARECRPDGCRFPLPCRAAQGEDSCLPHSFPSRREVDFLSAVSPAPPIGVHTRHRYAEHS